MKKIVIILILLIMPLFVWAECSYQDQLNLNSKAANVRTNYELKTDRIEYEDGVSYVEYFVIHILNVTNETYVELSNNVEDGSKIYHYSDTTDGNVDIIWTKTEDIANFTVKVYAESGTACSGDLLKTSRFTMPKYNGYYNRAICEEIPDFYLCQKYISVETVDESEFVSKVEGYINGTVNKDGEKVEEKEDKKGILEFINKNKWYIIGAAGVIGVGVGVFVYLKKTKKQRELGI